ncbi:MAG: AMP-binding protein [Acidobacteria bacterium]|nr:AMP-binding protein [Acidobacteriota bacterium]
MKSIARFFDNKGIFITGATGFLGQAIVEKILSVAPDVRRICLLIRPKRQFGGGVLTPQERLEREVFESSVFERFRSNRGDRWREFLRDKLVAITGDISQAGLGLDPQVRSWLAEDTDVIINSAALVSFDAPLDDALAENITSAQRVAEFARECRKAVLIHISTAYVSGSAKESIPETLHHTAAGEERLQTFPERKFTDIEKDLEQIEFLIHRVHKESQSPELERRLKQLLLAHLRKSRGGKHVRRREKLESLRRKWIKNRLTEEGMKWSRQRGWNDTYTYTKALGEQVIAANRGDVPTAIIRPSVIESSLAEPSPGWLDGLRMADPLIAAIGKGRLRSLPLNPNIAIDLVPVDMVVNALLAAVPATHEKGGLQIYQVATGARNPITLGALYNLIYRYFLKNPLFDKNGHPIKVKRLKFPNRATFRFQHRLRSVPLTTAERTLERFPLRAQKLKRKISATKAAFEKLYYYGEIYEPYLNLECSFEIDNSLHLWEALSAEEQRLFNFNVRELNWRHYIQNVHIPGVKKYILKMEQESRPAEASVAAVPLQIGTIPELLSRSAARLPQKTALQIKRHGQWHRFSFSELLHLTEEVSRRLRRMGLKPRERVVLFSENQPEWAIAYIGAVASGLTVVPMDSQTAHWEVWSVARFTEARAILASEDCFKSLTPEELMENENSGTPILLLNVNQRGLPFNLEQFPRSTMPDQAVIPEQELRHPVDMGPDDIASIIFTTGTAVDPRGAMHTHKNFINNLLGVNRYLPIYETDSMLSVLPLYHALEFTCGLLMPIFGGATVTYSTSLKPRVILETMRETGTTCLLGVPTLYALIRDDIERRIARVSKSRIKSNFISTSKQLSRSVERAFGTNIGRHLFAPIHQEFGGKIRVFVSGGSALGKELYDDFKTLGMPIYEGYGLTETAPVLTVNPFKRSRRGSAGKALPGVELRISHPNKDGVGEIIARSPSLMVRYFNNPEATQQVVKDGWFHTGDLGWIDEDGYLYFTGRIKDVIVTGAGKNVYPADLETIYRRVSQIDDICVVGLKNNLTEDVHAVIVPKPQILAGSTRDEVKKTLQKEIQLIAKEVPSYQRLQFLHVWEQPLPRKSSGGLDRAAIKEHLLRQLGERSRTMSPAPLPQSSGRKVSREQEVFDELSRLSQLPVEKIVLESHLQSDLGLDSLAVIELLLFLEHRFQISIPDEKVAQITTVGELLNALRLRHPAPPRKIARSALPVLRSTLPFRERPFLDRWLMGFSFSTLKTLFRFYFDLELNNSESLPQSRPYIIAANHSSHLDTGAVISAVSAARGVREAQKLHVLGASDYFFDKSVKRWFFSTFLNVVPIERQESSLAGLRMVKSILNNGEPILIFPEGTRSRSGMLQPFKAGLGLIAWELKVPIVPVAIEGTFQAMPVGTFLPRRRRVRVTFGDPVFMEDYQNLNGQLSGDALYRKIAADVRLAIEQLRPESHPIS